MLFDEFCVVSMSAVAAVQKKKSGESSRWSSGSASSDVWEWSLVMECFRQVERVEDRFGHRGFRRLAGSGHHGDETKSVRRAILARLSIG